VNLQSRCLILSGMQNWVKNVNMVHLMIRKDARQKKPPR
jgi:hypothetical protein